MALLGIVEAYGPNVQSQKLYFISAEIFRQGHHLMDYQSPCKSLSLKAAALFEIGTQTAVLLTA